MTERLDKSYLVREYLKAKGLVKNQLESFNLFVRGIKDIVLGISEFLRYKDVYVGNPSLNPVDREASDA
ncbi:unnamed protein product [Cuscuta campestris]|uniref:Uncharacterized protein n=1 Tax=Cuscuta campestris TaxID=132261 RepID=A0A484MMA9_9ASTE|nr:unnamed protein product [Cuscuta campestris]